MVAKFVSVEDFAIRAGLGSTDDLADEITAKAQASLEAATVHLRSYIRDEFDAVTGQVDEFYVDYGELPYVGEFPRLFLSRGFVTTPVGSLVVKTADQKPDLSAATAITNDYTVLDSDKGTLLITGTDRLEINALQPLVSGTRFFAQVTYDAGFAEQADAFGSVYVDAPDYLAEAAQILAKSIFDMGQPCKAGEATGPNGCPCTISELINRYIRWAPSALKPMS